MSPFFKKNLWCLSGLMFATQCFGADFEKYSQEHFDNIYKQINALTYQNTVILDFKRELGEVRSENRLLRDQVEVLNRKISLLEESQKNFANSIPSNGVNVIGNNQQNPISSPVGGTFPSVESDRTNLLQAKTLLRNKASDQAIAILEQLTISNSREVSLESQYWLGVAYVTKKECARARPYLLSFYNTAPTHELASEAMLAVAICERDSGNTKAYQDVIAKIKALYPNSRAAKAVP